VQRHKRLVRQYHSKPRRWCRVELHGNGVLYPGPTIIGGLGTGVPYIRIARVMEIDAPANGAVYSPGQVVDANW
jgi:hypothetical protein